MNGQYNIGDVVLHNWTLTHLLGEGSYGKVFEARREDFAGEYSAAIKIIVIPKSREKVKEAIAEGRTESSASEYFRSVVEDMSREFALMSKLKGDSYIVSYEDHEVIKHTDGIGWDIIIRMELLTPFSSVLEKEKLAEEEIINLGIDLCHALERCRKHNIIHRDIKPANIFRSETGHYKLGDFGVARTIDRTTGGSTQAGSYGYMAPEVFHVEPYGASVDIYSLGIVLYQLLNNNRTPFLPPYPVQIRKSDREAALARRMGGEQIPFPENNRGRLAEIALKACAYDPKDRYSSPTDMREALEKLLRGEDSGVTGHENIQKNGQYNIGDVVLHGWTLTRLIGTGSYGKVFEAKKTDLAGEHYAAFKILVIPQTREEINEALSEGITETAISKYFFSFVKEISKEFTIMSKLKGHSNIVSYLDHYVIPHTDGIGWDIIIHMELLTPFSTILRTEQLTKEDVVKMSIDICRALELCRKNNIIHRNIKLDNIFRSETGHYKLGDFGAACTTDEAIGGVTPVGTPNYMAPEIYKKEPYGFTVDIYSLGVVMYRLLNNNRIPFLPPYPIQIRMSDREVALERRMRGEKIPYPANDQSRLAEIVLKTCAYDPKDRYSSPTDLREALEKLLK